MHAGGSSSGGAGLTGPCRKQTRRSLAGATPCDLGVGLGGGAWGWGNSGGLASGSKQGGLLQAEQRGCGGGGHREGEGKGGAKSGGGRDGTPGRADALGKRAAASAFEGACENVCGSVSMCVWAGGQLQTPLKVCLYARARVRVVASALEGMCVYVRVIEGKRAAHAAASVLEETYLASRAAKRTRVLGGFFGGLGFLLTGFKTQQASERESTEAAIQHNGGVLVTLPPPPSPKKRSSPNTTGRGSRRGSAAHEGHEYGGSASQPEAAFPDIVIAPNAERRTHR
eukprot:1150607-Pelagomonas_calceolata.AAC.2